MAARKPSRGAAAGEHPGASRSRRAGPAPRVSDTELLRMRDLERTTGVGRETIRYYIREGLLPEPHRRGRNVALYDSSFVERVRLIKELQQTRFLPLQVIRALLASGTARTIEEARALTQLDGRLFTSGTNGTANGTASRVREPLAAVAERSGLSSAEVLELASAGAILLDGPPRPDVMLEPEDVEIVERWAAMRRAGYADALGFVPANLRVHAGMLDVLVDEELRMFTRGIAGRVDAETSARMAEAGIAEVGHMLALMRRRRILRAIAAARDTRGGEA